MGVRGRGSGSLIGIVTFGRMMVLIVLEGLHESVIVLRFSQCSGYAGGGSVSSQTPNADPH